MLPGTMYPIPAVSHGFHNPAPGGGPGQYAEAALIYQATSRFWDLVLWACASRQTDADAGRRLLFLYCSDILRGLQTMFFREKRKFASAPESCGRFHPPRVLSGAGQSRADGNDHGRYQKGRLPPESGHAGKFRGNSAVRSEKTYGNREKSGPGEAWGLRRLRWSEERADCGRRAWRLCGRHSGGSIGSPGDGD